MLSDCCLSCTSVCPVLSPIFGLYVCCGQIAAWINMPLGMEVGLGPSDFVLDGTQLPIRQRGTAPQIFGPYLLRLNGCMDQDVTWYGARPRPNRLCVRWGPRCPLPKRGAVSIWVRKFAKIGVFRPSNLLGGTYEHPYRR